MKAYSGSHSQGCHICGGFPGSLKTPVPKLLQCLKCGFFTCNKHLKGSMAQACPNCGASGKDLRSVMTQTSQQGVKSGGMPGHVQAKARVSKGQHEDDIEMKPSTGFGSRSSGAAAASTRNRGIGGSTGASEERVIISDDEDIVQRTLASSKKSMDDSLKQRMDSMYTLPTLSVNQQPSEDSSEEKEDEDFTWEELLGASQPNEEGVSSSAAVSLDGPFSFKDDDLETASIDYEALEMMERVLKEQEQGLSLTRHILADAFFRFENSESLALSEKFLEKDKDGIHVISFDLYNKKNLEEVYKLTKRSSQVFAVTAYSPKSIQDNKLPDLDNLKVLFKKKNKFIAIGEVGMDLHFSSFTKKLQEELMEKQIRLACQLNVPVYITSKKADAEVYRILDKLRDEGLKPTYIVTPVIRTVELFQMVLDHACYLLIRPEITLPQEDLYREALKEIPLERLLLASGEETSAPLVFTGRWNSPEFIEETVKASVDMFKMERKDFIRKMAKNFNSLFNSDPEANDDEFDFRPTEEKPSLIIPEAKLLENDHDADGDEIYIKDIEDRGIIGVVRFDREKRLVIYTPKKGFFGPDKFVYEISDGRGGSAKANVIINVMRG